ncbi:MAG TPA: hypothetical protein VFO50_03825 [Candidatus Limnocylindrales bacterium]|nr:hypothetical protein [Candidatus Limnocylindrales bacterium]
MDLWPSVVATVSTIALLVALAARARQGDHDDQRGFRAVLLGAAALVIAVAAIAFVWTLTRPI